MSIEHTLQDVLSELRELKKAIRQLTAAIQQNNHT